MERTLTLLLAAVLLVLPLLVFAQTRADASAELRAVQERIKALSSELERQSRKRSSAERELAEVEKAEQQARKELASLRAELDKSRARQTELEQQVADGKMELDRQQSLLATQARVAYFNGSEEWLRVALNQQDATALGRRMTYYAYLSRQRAVTIVEVEALLVSLELAENDLRAELARLAELEAAAESKLASVAATRSERAELVRRINADIQTKDAEIDRLQAQATELSELVAALARVSPDLPVIDAEPFAGKAASLSWPVQAKVRTNFGDPRAGGRLKWQGVILGAAAGSPVQAVYHGRVVFADWLDGMGLLTIIDHGGGFMSLYGHNQDLLRDVGDAVGPGDVIAHVGDSGGQNAAGLYFEIRKDGKPVDPRRWIR
jgi:septal ring factor EnvC (AmiA/AmiB activator)